MLGMGHNISDLPKILIIYILYISQICSQGGAHYFFSCDSLFPRISYIGEDYITGEEL